MLSFVYFYDFFYYFVTFILHRGMLIFICYIFFVRFSFILYFKEQSNHNTQNIYTHTFIHKYITHITRREKVWQKVVWKPFVDFFQTRHVPNGCLWMHALFLRMILTRRDIVRFLDGRSCQFQSPPAGADIKQAGI